MRKIFCKLWQKVIAKCYYKQNVTGTTKCENYCKRRHNKRYVFTLAKKTVVMALHFLHNGCRWHLRFPVYVRLCKTAISVNPQVIGNLFTSNRIVSSKHDTTLWQNILIWNSGNQTNICLKLHFVILTSLLRNSSDLDYWINNSDLFIIDQLKELTVFLPKYTRGRHL